MGCFLHLCVWNGERKLRPNTHIGVQSGSPTTVHTGREEPRKVASLPEGYVCLFYHTMLGELWERRDHRIAWVYQLF